MVKVILMLIAIGFYITGIIFFGQTATPTDPAVDQANFITGWVLMAVGLVFSVAFLTKLTDDMV
jgi:hypothetical protein